MVKYLDKAGLEHLVNGIKNLLYGKVDKVNGKVLSDQNYSLAEKNKLEGIETGANKYVHSSVPGNKHIPVGGSAGKILRWQSDGTAAWGDDINTTYDNATETQAGLMPAADKKLINSIQAITNAEIDKTAK